MMDTEILLPEYTGFLSGTKWITTWDYVWSVHTKTLSLWVFNCCLYSLGFFFIYSNSLIFSWLILASFSGIASMSVYSIFLFFSHSLSFVLYMYFSDIADYCIHTLILFNSKWLLYLSCNADCRVLLWKTKTKCHKKLLTLIGIKEIKFY